MIRAFHSGKGVLKPAGRPVSPTAGSAMLRHQRVGSDSSVPKNSLTWVVWVVLRMSLTSDVARPSSITGVIHPRRQLLPCGRRFKPAGWARAVYAQILPRASAENVSPRTGPRRSLFEEALSRPTATWAENRLVGRTSSIIRRRGSVRSSPIARRQREQRILAYLASAIYQICHRRDFCSGAGSRNSSSI